MAISSGRRTRADLRDVVPSRRGVDVSIVNDPGEEISSYVYKFSEMRATGEHIVIDGPCLSACTLLTGIVPRDNVRDEARRTRLHDDASRTLVPTRAGSRLIMRLQPSEIRSWIDRHGGLTRQLITMRGHDLAALYPTCQKY